MPGTGSLHFYGRSLFMENAGVNCSEAHSLRFRIWSPSRFSWMSSRKFSSFTRFVRASLAGWANADYVALCSSSGLKQSDCAEERSHRVVGSHILKTIGDENGSLLVWKNPGWSGPSVRDHASCG